MITTMNNMNYLFDLLFVCYQFEQPACVVVVQVDFAFCVKKKTKKTKKTKQSQCETRKITNNTTHAIISTQYFMNHT